MSWFPTFLAQSDDQPPPATDRHPELDQMLVWPQPNTPRCNLCGIAGHSAPICVTWPCERPAATVSASGCEVCSFPADHHDDEVAA